MTRKLLLAAVIAATTTTALPTASFAGHDRGDCGVTKMLDRMHSDVRAVMTRLFRHDRAATK